MNSPNGFDIDNVLLDQWTGVGLLVQNGGVYYYDFTDQAPAIVPYKWRSKTYQQLSAKNFEAIKVWFTVPPSTPPQVDRNVSDPQPDLGPTSMASCGSMPTASSGPRASYGRAENCCASTAASSEQWQFEVEGRVNVSNLQVATSVKELGLYDQPRSQQTSASASRGQQQHWPGYDG